ncbi:MAG: pilus assembly protein PilM [Phycisphaeraceae bacterium]|nr:pilus assembly protein PilM [Phycisphaeraceae bacterium]
MAFSVFQNQLSPIAIDFGTASIKMLQVSVGEKPQVVAAGELPIPDAIRGDTEKLLAYCNDYVPGLLSSGKFRAKRAVIALPSSRTFIQHMQLPNVEGTTRLDQVKGQLQMRLGVSPEGLVIRYRDVTDIQRGGQLRHEAICFAIARDTVMHFVEMLRRFKLNVVGVHPETQAMIHAFSHLFQTDADRGLTTMFVDLGWGGAQVAIAHGDRLVLARYIAIGGRQMDQRMAAELHCDVIAARTQRLGMGDQARRAARGERSSRDSAILSAASDAWSQAVGAGTATKAPPRGTPSLVSAKVDLTELVDTIADELAMCLRYHASLFPDREVDRLVLAGGEARQLWLGRAMAERLGIPTFLGDPLLRLLGDAALETPGVDLREPQPGWTVACGLCSAPTDL